MLQYAVLKGQYLGGGESHLNQTFTQAPNSVFLKPFKLQLLALMHACKPRKEESLNQFSQGFIWLKSPDFSSANAVLISPTDSRKFSDKVGLSG